VNISGRTLPAVLLIVAALTSCAKSVPSNKTMVQDAHPGVMMSLPDGGIRYTEARGGSIWDVDRDGVRSRDPVARIQTSSITGLALDSERRTFATWVDESGQFLVGQVSPGPIRLIWRGPLVGVDHQNVGGRLAFTPAKRLVVALGNLGQSAAENDRSPAGKLLTLDPDRDISQTPNIVSKGWTNPLGIAYMQEMLWVVDQTADGEASIGRSGPDGFAGRPTALGRDADPSGLTLYGDKELVVCKSNDNELQRYLVSEVEAVQGRLVGDDCNGDVVELADGRLAYTSLDRIKVTKH
jgi:hypothetical protein